MYILFPKSGVKKKTVSLFLLLMFFSASLPAQETSVAELVKQGIALHDKGDYEAAIDLYKKALLKDKRSAQATYEMASSYFALKDYEMTVKCSNDVIAINTDYMDQAYILKGSAYDLLGKPLEAIKTYKEGIKKYKNNHLLYYNLALTSFNLKQYADADDALQKALKVNPAHASSHLLLGYANIMQEKRVKGIFALYNFLLFEPTGSRAVSALKLLEEQLAKGVKKDSERSVTITMPSQKGNDEFYTMELMLGLLESSKSTEANKNKSVAELFVENTNSFFNISGELKKDKKNFWWNFYVDYFYTLATNKHTEAFCYYITQSKEAVYSAWLEDKENLKKLDAFSNWYSKYLHKY